MTEAKIELVDLTIVEGSFVDKGDNPEAHIAFFKRADDDTQKADWSTAFISDLPDSAFLLVESGGDKDADGKTVPRSLRHFPVRDQSGAVDLPHLRNALSRIPQASTLPAPVRARLTREATRMLSQATKGYAEGMAPMLEVEAPSGVPRTLAEVEHDEAMEEIKEALVQSVFEIVTDASPGEWPRLLGASAEQLADRLAEMGHEILKLSVERSPDDNNEANASSVVNDGNERKETMTVQNKTKVEEVLAALSAEDRSLVEARFAEVEARVETSKAAQVDVEKRLADLEKRATDAESEVAKMKDEKMTAIFVAKAKEIGGGTDVNQTATLLKGAYLRSDEEGKALEATLRGLAAQAKLGATLFKSIGTTGEGSDSSSPDAMIEADAQKIMSADPKVGYHAAYKLALSRNRDAYSRVVRGVNVE